MASYTTNLKTWGAAGAEYPDGYNYVEGEQPVDEWDNFLTTHIVSDIKDHLIPLTNSRFETDYGGTGGEPGSPEESHLYHDQGNERLELWDADKGAWRDIMFRDGDTMTGALDMGNYPVEDHTDLVDNNDRTVWDYSAGHIPQARLENDSVTVNAGTGIASGGTVALGGSLTVDVDTNSIATRNWVNNNAEVPNADFADTADSLQGGWDTNNGPNFRYSGRRALVSNTGELTIDYNGDHGIVNVQSALKENSNRVATRTWVNNNADVPNADYADTAGDADTAQYFVLNNNGGGVDTGVDSNGRFWMAPRDGNGNSNYSREITYNPSVNEWDIEGTPLAGGDKIATRKWTNNNADVPNADYANTAGDADTVDGNHASDLETSTATIQEQALAYDFI